MFESSTDIEATTVPEEEHVKPKSVWYKTQHPSMDKRIYGDRLKYRRRTIIPEPPPVPPELSIAQKCRLGKSASFPVESELELKKQSSAPSYFYCLMNETPPFKRPAKEPKPCLMIGSLTRGEVTEQDVLELIAASAEPNGLVNYIQTLLERKGTAEKCKITEINFLTRLVLECISYAAQRDFSAHSLAIMLSMYLNTHVYFKWFYWQSVTNVWKYFKELCFRHSILDTPYGDQIFEPDAVYDILSHFHTLYISNLPLIHILTFGSYCLKINWAFDSKTKK